MQSGGGIFWVFGCECNVFLIFRRAPLAGAFGPVRGNVALGSTSHFGAHIVAMTVGFILQASEAFS